MKAYKKLQSLYTDYPITELGDVSGKIAPIRKCKLISYDRNKYVQVQIDGTDVIKEVKSGYIYKIPLRLLEYDDSIYKPYTYRHRELCRYVKKGYIKLYN